MTLLTERWQNLSIIILKDKNLRLCLWEKVKVFINSEQEEWESELIKIRLTVKLFWKLIFIIVRVGGGYLSIDEFLDQYTPAELEKMERKDPLKKFSEKVAV